MSNPTAVLVSFAYQNKYSIVVAILRHDISRIKNESTFRFMPRYKMTLPAIYFFHIRELGNKKTISSLEFSSYI